MGNAVNIFYKWPRWINAYLAIFSIGYT